MKDEFSIRTKDLWDSNVNNKNMFGNKPILVNTISEPRFFGTFTHNYINYLLDRETYNRDWVSHLNEHFIAKNKSAPKLLDLMDRIKNNLKLNTLDHEFLSKVETLYRHRNFHYSDPGDTLEWYTNRTVANSNFTLDFNSVTPLLRQQSKVFVNRDVKANVQMKSSKVGMKADADLIIGNTIYEIKFSKEYYFTLQYYRQLISYVILDILGDNPIGVNRKKVGYWNPRYGIIHEFDVNVNVNVNDKLINSFEKLIEKYKHV